MLTRYEFEQLGKAEKCSWAELVGNIAFPQAKIRETWNVNFQRGTNVRIRRVEQRTIEAIDYHGATAKQGLVLLPTRGEDKDKELKVASDVGKLLEKYRLADTNEHQVHPIASVEPLHIEVRLPSGHHNIMAGLQRSNEQDEKALLVVYKELELKGIVKEVPVSYVQYCSPTFLIVRKTSTVKRPIADLKRLNEFIVAVAYPLPELESTLQEIGRATLFSQVDLTLTYFSFPVTEESGRYLCVRVGAHRFFSFTWLPMGGTIPLHERS